MYQATRNSDYRISEYLLILSPTHELGQRIWSIKHDFAKIYQAWLASKTGPHITLTNFLAYGKREERIINFLQLIGRGITPFNVDLKNFGAFETSRTIYINIATKESIRHLVGELKQARRLLTLNKQYTPRFIYEPHVTICRGLNPIQYTAGWTGYANRSFSGSFTAGYMTLLKKPYGENRCSTVGQFPFQSTPSLPKQGLLFT